MKNWFCFIWCQSVKHSIFQINAIDLKNTVEDTSVIIDSCKYEQICKNQKCEQKLTDRINWANLINMQKNKNETNETDTHFVSN